MEQLGAFFISTFHLTYYNIYHRAFLSSLLFPTSPNLAPEINVPLELYLLQHCSIFDRRSVKKQIDSNIRRFMLIRKESVKIHESNPSN